jgi:hypothetical protein
MKTSNLKLILDISVLTVFAFGILYVLDDIARLISMHSILAEINLYGFFIGTPIIFILSLFSIRKWNERRFKYYVALSGFQLLVVSIFIYIVMHSQV